MLARKNLAKWFMKKVDKIRFVYVLTI